MLKWLDAGPAQAFGAEIAREIIRLLGKVEAESKVRDKHRSKLERVLTRVHRFGQTESLNVYKKARFGQAVRESLIEAGYPKPLAEDLVRLALTRL
jgi:hypothetical protein